MDLPLDLWALVLAAAATSVDAASLASTCRVLRAAYGESAWSRRVRVSPSGRVWEPVAGFDEVADPFDVQQAMRRCPRGGSVLLTPGEYGSVVCSRPVHLFGRGRATLRAVDVRWEDADEGPDEMSTLDRATVSESVYVFGGELRLQRCDLAAVTVHGGGRLAAWECVVDGWVRGYFSATVVLEGCMIDSPGGDAGACSATRRASGCSWRGCARART